jgi:hypothetical protein
LDKKATAKGNILKSLKEKTSQSYALVKIDAQRGFAPPPRQFLFFLPNLSISYLSRYVSYPKLRFKGYTELSSNGLGFLARLVP